MVGRLIQRLAGKTNTVGRLAGPPCLESIVQCDLGFLAFDVLLGEL